MSDAKVIAIDGGKHASIAETQEEFAKLAKDIGAERLKGFVITAVLEDGSTLTALNPGNASLFTLMGALEWSKHRVRNRIEESQ